MINKQKSKQTTMKQEVNNGCKQKKNKQQNTKK